MHGPGTQPLNCSDQKQRPRSGVSSILLYLRVELHCMPGRLLKAVRRAGFCCNAGHPRRGL